MSSAENWTNKLGDYEQALEEEKAAKVERIKKDYEAALESARNEYPKLRALAVSLGIESKLTSMRDEMWKAGHVRIENLLYETVFKKSNQRTYSPAVRSILTHEWDNGNARESLGVIVEYEEAEIVLKITREVYDALNKRVDSSEGNSFPAVKASDPLAEEKITDYFTEDLYLRMNHGNFPLPYDQISEPTKQTPPPPLFWE